MFIISSLAQLYDNISKSLAGWISLTALSPTDQPALRLFASAGIFLKLFFPTSYWLSQVCNAHVHLSDHKLLLLICLGLFTISFKCIWNYCITNIAATWIKIKNQCLVKWIGRIMQRKYSKHPTVQCAVWTSVHSCYNWRNRRQGVVKLVYGVSDTTGVLICLTS